MKCHHLVSLFLFIFGGSFAYMQFHHGDIDRAIRTSIICIILGIVTLLFEKLRSWLRPVGITVPFIFLGLMAAHAVFTGDIGMAIFLFIWIILMAVLHFFQDTPFVKKIQPWLG